MVRRRQSEQMVCGLEMGMDRVADREWTHPWAGGRDALPSLPSSVTTPQLGSPWPRKERELKQRFYWEEGWRRSERAAALNGHFWRENEGSLMPDPIKGRQALLRMMVRRCPKQAIVQVALVRIPVF